jgi:hypothetical protein
LQLSAISLARLKLPTPCHAERNREERIAILTAQSKHPYHPDDLNPAAPSKIYP